MNPNQSIAIQLTDAEGRPLTIKDVLVDIQFFTNGYPRYVFKAGCANEMGTRNISYADVEKLRIENAKFF